MLYTLLSFNQNYSSWSMRPLIVVRKYRLPVDLRVFDLADTEGVAVVKSLTPSGLLPTLLIDAGDGHAASAVPESLAIIETLADLFPDKTIWPRDVVMRAKARSVSAQMHAGFASVRNSMPCNMRARYPERNWPTEVAADIKRICTIWQTCREEVVAKKVGEDDGWLFGSFSGADAMYFPVVTRFLTYSVKIDESEFPLAKDYMARVLRDATVREMYEIAENEEFVVDKYENVYPNEVIEKLTVSN
ncbi:hypothetical protein HDU84_005893 [Entophlyctis sp. JEL0112]|nr:hypothetical protein HDU84_005893 [Entophlyctis sp. JEL0112]